MIAITEYQGSQMTSYLYMDNRWAGAWDRPVNDSRYAWIPINIDSATQVLVYTRSAMYMGNHTLRVRVPGDQNSSTIGIAITADMVKVIVSESSNLLRLRMKHQLLQLYQLKLLNLHKAISKIQMMMARLVSSTHFLFLSITWTLIQSF